MSTRNLDALFSPRAIALIGASNAAGSVGQVLARNLYGGGFEGPILSVNPHETAVRSALSYRSVEDLPITPDLAVVATPAATVPSIIDSLGRRGCRAAVVISAGLGAEAPGGGTLRQAMLDASRPHLLRIVGPNGLGFISPGRGLNASFAHTTPHAGDLAVLSQSGAVLTAMIDWAVANAVGFSHLVSLGDMADVDFGDLLDHLALDAETKAILLYVETVTHARKFMSAARIASRAKPVIVVKGGRSASGARAALSHTGALAGSDVVHQAAFRRAGMLQVDTLAELFEAARTLTSRAADISGPLLVVTNGGGAGVLAADEAERRGLPLASLDSETIERLDAVLPSSWSRANPVDILGDADGARYRAALELLSSRRAETLLVMNCPTGVADGAACAEAVRGVALRRPLIACWLGEQTAQVGRRILTEAGAPVYATPEAAVRAMSHLHGRRRNLEALLHTPPARSGAAVDRASARDVISRALTENRTVLTAPETKGLLQAYGVPVVTSREAPNASAAAAIAAELGRPVALKILSPDISHKSDLGGVALNLAPGDVQLQAEAMAARIRQAAPAARLEGFIVEAMAPRDGRVELIIGMIDDPTFGPLILAGAGGVAVEALDDKALELPPLNLASAREMIGRTRVSRLLAGYRNVPPADLDAVASVLVAVSDMLVDLPELVELDINPLSVGSDGVIAVDARAVVRKAAPGASERLALKPYPAELERELRLADGAALRLRPIRPEDEPALIEMGRRSRPEDLRLRFFTWIKTFSHSMAARLSQIDYDREMALVAIEPNGAIAGVSRLICDPDFDQGEFALIVRSDIQGRGLGRGLLMALRDYAAGRGVRRLVGEVLAENATMLKLVHEVGGRTAPTSEPGIVRAELDLGVSIARAPG